MKPPRDVQLDADKLRLKFATRKTIKANGGTALAAENCGSRQQRMSDVQLTNVPDFLRLDEALDLETNAEGSPGWPAITRVMARHHGFDLMPVPDGPPAGKDIYRALADCHREASEASAKALEALADDNHLSAEEVERHQIIEEVDQAIAAFAALRSLLQAASDSGG